MSKKKAMFFKGASGGFTDEYQAILDEATAQAYTLPSEADQATQNDMIVAAQASGVWDKLDLFYSFTLSGGADFKKINWKNPTGVKIVEVNSSTSPAYTATGVQQITARSRLALGYTYLELTNYTQNSASYFLDAVSVGTSYFECLGSRDSSNYNFMNLGGFSRPKINSVSTNGSILFTAINGLVGAHRSSATDVQITQEEAVKESSTAFPSDVKENSEIFILGRQVGSISAGLGFDGELGFFAIGGYMKDDAQNMIDAFRI